MAHKVNSRRGEFLTRQMAGIERRIARLKTQVIELETAAKALLQQLPKARTTGGKTGEQDK